MQKGGAGNVNMPQVGKVGSQEPEEQTDVVPGKVQADISVEPPALPDDTLVQWVRGPKAKGKSSEEIAKGVGTVPDETQKQLLKGLQSAALQKVGITETNVSFFGHAADRLGVMLQPGAPQQADLPQAIEDLGPKLSSIADRLRDFMDDHSEELMPDIKDQAQELQKLIENASKQTASVKDWFKNNEGELDEAASKKTSALRESLLGIGKQIRSLSLDKSAANQLKATKDTLVDAQVHLQRMSESVAKKLKESPREALVAILNYIKYAKDSLVKLDQQLDQAKRAQLPKTLQKELDASKIELKSWLHKIEGMLQQLKTSGKAASEIVSKNGPELDQFITHLLDTISPQVMLAETLTKT